MWRKSLLVLICLGACYVGAAQTTEPLLKVPSADSPKVSRKVPGLLERLTGRKLDTARITRPFYRHLLLPLVFYDNADRLYGGLRYELSYFTPSARAVKHKHRADLHYSLSQKGVSAEYEAAFNRIAGDWNLGLLLGYDAVRWTNYFGLGNETVQQVRNNQFNRFRTREWLASLSFFRQISPRHFASASLFWQHITLLADTDRFILKNREPVDTALYAGRRFAGINLQYTYTSLDDVIVPRRGLAAAATLQFAGQPGLNRHVWRYGFNGAVYVPLGARLGWVSRAGLSRVSGAPEIYQYASTGGSQTIRGYRRDRFRGTTAVYNANELQWLHPVSLGKIHGKAGWMLFADQGRVWMPGERSDRLHYSYGAGIILAPLNKLMVSLTYGISREDRLLQLRVNRNFQ